MNDAIQTKSIWVPDTYSDAQGDDTYCGYREFTISVSSTETDWTLATDLLACNTDASCLSVTVDSTGYNIEMSLEVNESKYGGYELTYDLYVYLYYYYDFPTPSETYTVTVTIYSETSCTSTSDLAGVTLLDADTGAGFDTENYVLRDTAG